jgi:acyl-coenzyme A thioesterase PaaI-like protein
MTATHVPLGPAALGIELGVDATVSDDGWLVRELTIGPGLDGPPGILQGGFSAGLCVSIARAADRFGAPLTSLDARLHAPTPLGRTLQARVRTTDTAARYRVETRDGDTLLVSGEVELAGQDEVSRVYDLLELATVPLPEPRPQDRFPTCWVCGAHPVHPHAQRLHPRPYGDGAQVVPWIPDEGLADARGHVDPLVVSAMLDCPGVWAAMPHVEAQGHTGALLAGYQLRVYRDAPVLEALRTVARMDSADGRKVRARSALVDEDGITYAVSSALHISVPEVPSLPR